MWIIFPAASSTTPAATETEWRRSIKQLPKSGVGPVAATAKEKPMTCQAQLAGRPAPASGRWRAALFPSISWVLLTEGSARVSPCEVVADAAGQSEGRACALQAAPGYRRPRTISAEPCRPVQSRYLRGCQASRRLERRTGRTAGEEVGDKPSTASGLPLFRAHSHASKRSLRVLSVSTFPDR